MAPKAWANSSISSPSLPRFLLSLVVLLDMMSLFVVLIDCWRGPGLLGLAGKDSFHLVLATYVEIFGHWPGGLFDC